MAKHTILNSDNYRIARSQSLESLSTRWKDNRCVPSASGWTTTRRKKSRRRKKKSRCRRRRLLSSSCQFLMSKSPNFFVVQSSLRYVAPCMPSGSKNAEPNTPLILRQVDLAGAEEDREREIRRFRVIVVSIPRRKQHIHTNCTLLRYGGIFSANESRSSRLAAFVFDAP